MLSRSKWFILASVFLTGLILRSWIYRSGLFFDDGMIVARVAENIAQGNGFCYNLGEHVQAATSILWSFVGALAWKVAPDGAFPLMRAMGAVFDSLAAVGLAALVLAAATSESTSGHQSSFSDTSLPALVAGLIYATASIAALAAPSGLETGLYAFLITLTFLAFVRSYIRVALVLSLLLVLTRPDGVLVPALFATYLWFKDRREFRVAAILYLISGVLYVIVVHSYFHSILPQTIVAKGLFRHSPVKEWAYLIHHFFGGMAAPTGALALAGAFEIMRSQSRLRIFVLWSVLYAACFATFSEWWQWYLPPIVLSYSVCIGFGLVFIMNLLRRLFRQDRWLVPAGLAFTALSAVASTIFTLHKLPAMSQAQDVRLEIRRRIASTLTAVSSSRDTVMLEPLGIVGFYTPRTFYDYPGLASPETTAVLRTLHSRVSRVLDEPPVTRLLLEKVRPDWLVLRQTEYEKDQSGQSLSACHLFDTFPPPSFQPVAGLGAFCGDCDTTMYLLKCEYPGRSVPTASPALPARNNAS